MGTYYSIKYVSDSGMPAPETIKAELDKRLEQVNDQMSTYRSNSELSRFNQSTEVNTPFPVSAATAKVVEEAIRINKVTDGALDITVGPLVNLWGFGPEGRPDRIPTNEEINQRRAWIGIEHLSVQGNALVKNIPQLYLDLSSIAKGYGVDVVAEYLASLKITNYMVDIGGEVRTRGINGDGAPWRIAIENRRQDYSRALRLLFNRARWLSRPPVIIATILSRTVSVSRMRLTLKQDVRLRIIWFRSPCLRRAV